MEPFLPIRVRSNKRSKDGSTMRRGTRDGMTALEFLGAFLGVLVAVFGFYYWGNAQIETNKRLVTIRRLTLIETALQKYCTDCAGTLPTQDQYPDALLHKPTARPIPVGWNGPYLASPETLVDGWGRPFKYLCPGKPLAPGSRIKRPFDLSSYGRNNREGGKGLDRDVCNWDRSSLIP